MKSVVKHKYIKAGAGRTEVAEAHIHYICYRPGACARGFFNATQEGIDKQSVYKSLEKNGRGRVVIHKLMLSPGTNSSDLQEYARDVMKNLCTRSGQDLDWYGVIHRNTDHWHVHVVVMGKDKNGQAVRFDKSSYGFMREVGDRFLWKTRFADDIKERGEYVPMGGAIMQRTTFEPRTHREEGQGGVFGHRVRHRLTAPGRQEYEVRKAHRPETRREKRRQGNLIGRISLGLGNREQAFTRSMQELIQQSRKNLAVNMKQQQEREKLEET